MNVQNIEFETGFCINLAYLNLLVNYLSIFELRLLMVILSTFYLQNGISKSVLKYF